MVKVIGLDPPFFNQFFQAIVDLPKTHTHLSSEFSLGGFWVQFKPAKQVYVDLFMVHLDTLPPYQYGIYHQHCDTQYITAKIAS